MEISTNTLTKTDVEKRLALKSKSLKHFPKFLHGHHAQYLKVEDFEDKQKWRFRLITRRRGYKKPVLSSGWQKFVKSKKLQIGDKVTFLDQEDETTRVPKYIIKIIRKPVSDPKPVTLFGVAIGYAPPSFAA